MYLILLERCFHTGALRSPQLSGSDLTPLHRLFSPQPQCITQLAVISRNVSVKDIKSNCEILTGAAAAHGSDHPLYIEKDLIHLTYSHLASFIH